MRTRSILASSAGLLLVLTSLSGVANAQKQIEFPHGNQGIRNEAVARPNGETRRAIRLSGTFAYNSRDGMTLDGVPVQFSAKTAFFPGTSSRTRALENSLPGKNATIYGRRHARGVDVSLVIVEGMDSALPDQKLDFSGLVEGVPAAESFRVPSQSDPDVGEMVDETPQ